MTTFRNARFSMRLKQKKKKIRKPDNDKFHKTGNIANSLIKIRDMIM